MKNLRRLIGAAFVIGIGALSAINVVACSNTTNNPTPSKNDLSSSFNSSYNTKPDGMTLTLDKLGLRVGVNNPAAYDFIFSNLNIDTINLILTAKSGSVIKNPIYTPATAQQLLPTATNQEIAVITGADQTGLLPPSTTNSVISFNVTLTMWKSEIQDTSFAYKATTTNMSVAINVTVPYRTSLANLGDVIVKIDPAPQDSFLTSFNNALIAQLKAQAGYDDLVAANIVVTKTGTDTALTLADFNNGSTIILALRIRASNTPGNFFGVKNNLTANIEYNMDLARLPVAATFSITTERDMSAFLNGLVGFWKGIAVFQTLTTAFINVTLENGDPIPLSQLIKGASFNIKVTQSQTPGAVYGNKIVAVTINT